MHLIITDLVYQWQGDNDASSHMVNYYYSSLANLNSLHLSTLVSSLVLFCNTKLYKKEQTGIQWKPKLSLTMVLLVLLLVN